MLSDAMNTTILLLSGGLIGLIIGLLFVSRVILVILSLLDFFNQLLSLIGLINKKVDRYRKIIESPLAGVLIKYEPIPQLERPLFIVLISLSSMLVGSIWLSPIRMEWWSLFGGVAIGLLIASTVLMYTIIIMINTYKALS